MAGDSPNVFAHGQTRDEALARVLSTLGRVGRCMWRAEFPTMKIGQLIH